MLLDRQLCDISPSSIIALCRLTWKQNKRYMIIYKENLQTHTYKFFFV